VAGGTTPSDWHDIDRRHRAGILLGAAVVLIAAAAGLVALLGGEPAVVPGGETTPTITPAEQTTETISPAPGYDFGVIGEEGREEVAASPDVPAPALDTARIVSGSVAYRRDGWVCVAGADGADERRVAESDSGAFALSPDGGTLAVIDDGSGQLVLVDVDSGDQVSVGPAIDDPPAWAPHSRWLVYTASGSHVMRIDRSGAAATLLMAGTMPAVSPDGRTVVAVIDAVRRGEIVVWQDGDTRRYITSVPISGVCCTDERVYYGAGPDASGAVSLRSMRLDGRGDRAELTRARSARPVAYADLLRSPDGSWVCFAERGDDGYSRAFALPAGGGRLVELSGRRDCYPLMWSRDGSAVYLIEGNAMQGEPTWLVSVTPGDGLRRTLVDLGVR